ncbi:MAG: hypothetical protein KAI47_26630 [Deltaproteobacteria bacterium]|nr:hypothetical protein [Deltaproteobacteria bacterium]
MAGMRRSRNGWGTIFGLFGCLGLFGLLALGAGCSGNVGGGQSGEGDGASGFSDGGLPFTDSGSGNVDGMPFLDVGSQKTWPTCATAKGEATATGGGVDIIWFIDTSGSMNQETAWVQQNLNAFASYIGAQNLDYRVIMIGKSSICVAPPLGGPSCTDGPRYRHVKEYVASTDGLMKVISTYPQWQKFLRKDTTKNFVAVTDDNSRKSASWFNTELAKLKDPGFPDGYIFHSIVAYGSIPGKGCSTGARIGTVYLELTQQTKGVKFPVCDQDWKSIFDKLAKSVAQTAKVPCSYIIPPAPAGKTFNPALIIVHRADVGNEGVIPKVADKASCGALGWYYDNPSDPKTVILCPQTCAAVSGGKIEIEFGCIGGIN